MIMVLFKLFVTFAILTAISLVSIKMIGDLIEAEVIQIEHEETIAKYTVSLLIGFSGMTALTFVLWAFGLVWML